MHVDLEVIRIKKRISKNTERQKLGSITVKTSLAPECVRRLKNGNRLPVGENKGDNKNPVRKDLSERSVMEKGVSGGKKMESKKRQELTKTVSTRAEKLKTRS